ncbi:MAG: site-specific recombinase, partial [Pseudonocardiales bacterium]|nr:site-specific recombinase [Pseudonocardiales bacterium]
IIEHRLSATSAHIDTVQANLKLALDLTSDCHSANLQARDHTRRLLNQALFEFIFIDEDGVRAALAEPFKTLLGPDVMEGVGRGQRPKATAPAIAKAATSGPKSRSDVRHDWNAAYIRRIRAQRPKTNKPASVQHGAGLKEVTLVRPKGFEPLTS